MQDGVRIFFGMCQVFDRLRGWHHDQLHVPRPSFVFDLFHDWQGAVGSGSDDQTSAVPRNSLGDGDWRMSERSAERLRWILLSLAYGVAVDQDVVLIPFAVDLYRAKLEFPELHTLSSTL